VLLFSREDRYQYRRVVAVVRECEAVCSYKYETQKDRKRVGERGSEEVDYLGWCREASSV